MLQPLIYTPNQKKVCHSAHTTFCVNPLIMLGFFRHFADMWRIHYFVYVILYKFAIVF